MCQMQPGSLWGRDRFSGAGQRQGRDLHILLVYAWSVPRREMRLVPGQEAGRKTDTAGGRAGGQDCGDGLEVS